MGRQVKLRDPLANVFQNYQAAIASHYYENACDDVPLNQLGSTGGTTRSHPASLSFANRTIHFITPAPRFLANHLARED